MINKVWNTKIDVGHTLFTFFFIIQPQGLVLVMIHPTIVSWPLYPAVSLPHSGAAAVLVIYRVASTIVTLTVVSWTNLPRLWVTQSAAMESERGTRFATVELLRFAMCTVVFNPCMLVYIRGMSNYDFSDIKSIYMIKEGREYRMLLYQALNVCGGSHTWNANNRCTSPYTVQWCLYLSVWLSLHTFNTEHGHVWHSLPSFIMYSRWYLTHLLEL